ncbi:EAL and GGDEF domain-containing protein [Thiohalorhabdus sp. Cl-TMA]|uniref:EAL domain-containing protein n=1 Tax=Thiohalorhabdus methylotrophus TaxID=3242694 RepID=A0ABV4TQ82_9GAMM
MPASLEHLLGQPLLQETPNAVVLIDDRQHIRYFNPAAERIFGYSRDEVLGRPLDWLIPDAVRAVHRDMVDRFVHGGEGTRRMGERGEICGRRKDGILFPAAASIARIQLNGEPHFVAILNELTDQRSLQEQRQRLAEILEATPDFVGIADTDGRVLYHNRAAQRLLGLPEKEPIRQWRMADSHPNWAIQTIAHKALPEAREVGYWEGETAFLDAGGTEIPVWQTILAHHAPDGTLRYFSTIARDLRPSREAQEELRKLSRALNQAADMVWITDTDGRLEYVNPAFEAATGYAAEEALGHTVGELLQSGWHDQSFYARLGKNLRHEQPHREISINRTRDGRKIHIDETISPVHNEAGEVTHYIATGRDVTERLALEERLRQLAYFDPLTSLPNRAQLEERLTHALTERTGEHQALILLDLDRFKYLNDTLGHPAGDDLLHQVARRLEAQVRSTDLVARLGGDEFVLFLDHLEGTEGAVQVAEKVLTVLRSPFEVAGHSLFAGASLGISLFPDDGQDAPTLLQHADTAMFEAKKAGGSQYRFFSRGLSEATAERFFVEKGIRRALDNGTVQAYFQPILDLARGRIVGAEALARCWFSDEGWIPPGRFIPVAEETGLIHELGEQILDQACAAFRTWWDNGFLLERVAVNLSPIQLDSESLPDRIQAILDHHDLAPCHLELEVTEEALLRDESAHLHQLRRLQGMGVAIALDDFGTGFSSPAYLKRFPASRMKIDRTFINGIDADPDNQTILQSLLVLADGFGFRVTAEGVETQAEADYLADLFCQEVQGFLFARPQAPQDFQRTLQRIGTSPGS